MTAVSKIYLRRAVLLAVGLIVALLLSVGRARAEFGFVPGGLAATLSTTQAGGHPDVTTTFEMNRHTETVNEEPFVAPDGLARDVAVELPAGLAGNPQAYPQCSAKYLTEHHACPPATQVGIARPGLLFNGHALLPGRVPVYNMVPQNGHVAEFAFTISIIGVHVNVAVRTGGDYGVTAMVSAIPSFLPLVSTTLTIWGVPSDPSHDAERWDPNTFSFGASSPVPLRPFLVSPSACGVPLTTLFSADSWEQPGEFVTEAAPSPPVLTGCERLSFAPSISVAPESHVAGGPSGYSVDVHVPQRESVADPATPDLREAVVRLPAGVAVNPSQASGLVGCSPAQIGLENAEKPGCPDASKIGTVEVDTPLLPVPLVGSVYVAQQGNGGVAQGSNPFGSLLAMYVAAEGGGVLIKLAGRIDTDPLTGQVTTTFSGLPQLPFEDFKLRLFGGRRAVLVNPPACGSYTATSSLTPWSAPASGPASTPESSFAIDGGCTGQFTPSFSAGTTSNQAGGFSPLSVTFGRQDGEQNLGGLSVKMPPGLLGVLKSVPLCGEPQAAQGTCGPESRIGHTTVGAGAGSPFYLGGQVFLTGPYKGAPFGLSIVVPAVAGPFNLGTVVVRAQIQVDPHTAQLTVISDPLPRILQGIPLDLRVVNVTVDRAGFLFNPTDCEALSVDGTVSSAQGASVGVSNHFQAANCAVLPFAPKFSASSLGKTSRSGGAALDVKVGYPQGAQATQANIHSVAVTLPKQLPARLSTIQLACPVATFEANPASCGEGSMVGTATASTPILSTPFTGPAYLVSHGGESFPDIVLVLQSQGVTIDLVGNVFITKTGITSATFAHVPDAPISGFELSLPEGPHSALSAVGSLCAGALSMPTTITGQNGAQIKQTTKIAVTGCPKAAKKKKKTKKHKAKKHKKK